MKFASSSRAILVFERLVAHQANKELHPLTCAYCRDFSSGQSPELQPIRDGRVVYLKCPRQDCGTIMYGIPDRFRAGLPPVTLVDEQYDTAPM